MGGVYYVSRCSASLRHGVDVPEFRQVPNRAAVAPWLVPPSHGFRLVPRAPPAQCAPSRVPKTRAVGANATGPSLGRGPSPRARGALTRAGNPPWCRGTIPAGARSRPDDLELYWPGMSVFTTSAELDMWDERAVRASPRGVATCARREGPLRPCGSPPHPYARPRPGGSPDVRGR